MDIIAVGNQKGGVGKSATVQNLAWTFAHDAGLETLVVDLDPQESTTESFGVADAYGSSMAEVLGGSTGGTKRMADILREIAPRLWLAPADISMAVTEIGLAGRLIGREAVLRTALAGVAGRFDVVLLDCPPSLGMLTINALMAARWVLSPTGPTPKDLRGLRLFLDTLAQIQPANPQLEHMGVLLTRYEPRLNLHRRALATVREWGLPLFTTTIGRSVKVSEAEELGQTVFTYDPHNPRVQEYRNLSMEVLECLNLVKA